MNIKEDLLPIGSVVLLKNGRKKIMIIGVKQKNLETNEVYDYLAVPYPEGFISADCAFFVNHDLIEKIYFRGYENEERETFLTALDNYYENQKNYKKESN